jgi:branched-chain amino acid transport system ATP-binding protein
MRVGIGRALVARPLLLCLDEPAAGLDARQSAELGRLLPGIASSGTAVLLVDHDMGLVLSSWSPGR